MSKFILKLKVQTTDKGRKYVELPDFLNDKMILMFPYKEVNHGLQDTNSQSKED